LIEIVTTVSNGMKNILFVRPYLDRKGFVNC
jgi:hypothetical protein